MLLSVVTNARRVRLPTGRGRRVGRWGLAGLRVSSTVTPELQPPGLEANKARRRHGGAPVPLFLCCSSWLTG